MPHQIVIGFINTPNEKGFTTTPSEKLYYSFSSPNETLISACLIRDKIDFITTPNAKLHIQMPHQMKYIIIMPC